MKTFGQHLQQSRIKKGLSLKDLAKQTSIAEEYLEALEQEKYAQLPAAPLARSYVQLIAQALEEEEETLLAFFRRDSNIAQQKVEQPFRRRMRLQPRSLSLFFLGCLLLIGTTWLLYQWTQVSRPPQLQVREPADYAVVSSPVTVSGTTDTEATVTINTEPISLDPQGNFQQELSLPSGERALVIEAKDKQGRVSRKILYITIE